jgi:glycosyltransferase involved in cell wall biosynthesis
MRVGLAVPGSRSVTSGIGRYVDQLEASLTSEGVSVEHVRFRHWPGAERRPVLQAVPIDIEAAHRSDILHFPQIKGASVLLGRRLHPAVVTVHDFGSLYCLEDQVLYRALDHFLIGLALRGIHRADHVVAVSDFTRDHALQYGFRPDRVTTVHQGVDLTRFGPRPDAAATLRRRYGIEPKGPWVLYVGNEQPRKNLTVLVAALSHLRQGGVPVHWVKVGAPVYALGRTELLRLIDRHGLSSHVTIIDHVPDDDLPLFYQAATVYAQPSIWEGFGLPVLEAMASGTPVVAAAAGALPEVCGDAALLVDPRDAQKLAMGLASLLTDEGQRRRLRTLGLRHVQRFTWAETARRTIQIYRSLLPETRGSQ